MTYSGRGIIVGMTLEGNAFIGYSLTGRSPSSQARRLVHDEKSNVIRTEVTDKEQLEQGSPALLLYPAIVFQDDAIIANNGAQTRLIRDRFLRNRAKSSIDILDTAFLRSSFEYDKKDQEWIDISTCEPDIPNNTPRISAFLRPNGATMHIVRNKDGKADQDLYPFRLEKGRGHLITTYSGGNENPLKPFRGNPLEMRVGSSFPEGIVNSIYDAIQGGANPEDNYCVSAAVMMLKNGKPEVAVKNRF